MFSMISPLLRVRSGLMLKQGVPGDGAGMCLLKELLFAERSVASSAVKEFGKEGR